MDQSTKQRFQELADTIESSLSDIEHIIRCEDPHLYEQWKAGGKHVTSEFVSMYPSLPEVVEKLLDENEQDDDQEDE